MGDARPMLAPTSAPVLRRWLWAGLVWLVPALMLLPVYLLLLAISVAASEGVLVESLMKARGRVHSALGLLLVLSAIAALVLMARVDDDESAINLVFFAIVCGGLGAMSIRRQLRRIAAEMKRAAAKPAGEPIKSSR